VSAQPELIDLIDDGQPQAPAGRSQPERQGETSWMYLNGEWVRVARRPGRQPARGQDDVLSGVAGVQPDSPMDALVTQRVIRISREELLNGRSTQNIVIRPGDVIRVPSPPQGFFYLGGEITRGGSYGLVEGITLERAIASAGGLTTIGIPERVDLTRMVGENRQATIRLNLRAIAERTQPDIYLKDNDYVNVGTNFWAFPAAVVRNGFRFTYGFGFLIDRNFGNDIFGAPPVNVR
jgi:polysaccharide export outer membrane protein